MLTNPYISKNHISQLDDRLLKVQHGLKIYQIGKRNIKNFTKFVFGVYQKDYKKKYNWESSETELDMMLQEDLHYFQNSIFIAIKSNSGKIIGTIRLSRKTTTSLPFPIEKEFGIDINTLVPDQITSPSEVWHCGRLTIDKDVVKEEGIQINAIKLFNILLLYAIKISSKNANNILVFESDGLLYKLLKSLKINAQLIGEPKEYLGSKTYPLMVLGKDFQTWYKNTGYSK